MGNPIGTALCDDIRAAYRNPRRDGFVVMVMREFGNIELPNGMTYKMYDARPVDCSPVEDCSRPRLFGNRDHLTTGESRLFFEAGWDDECGPVD